MKQLIPLACAGLLAGCQTTVSTPMETVAHVDLPRFVGDWYVIAHIPTYPERNAYNAVESYALQPDGSVATTFTFREGGFDGKVQRMTPTGYITDRHTNATWGMQFIWPIKADYRITYLTPDYGITVIARQKRDYVWVMARKPQIGDAERKAVEAHIVGLGYDLGELRYVPQRWGAAT
jgi:apolipoprotein D and lipocalin family protein